MPMARQVNKNELPPILIKGKVTPVTGNKFTFTAILANAWITRVKLNPNAEDLYFRLKNRGREVKTLHSPKQSS